MNTLNIGFFDSGMGGISVLAKAIELLPNEHFIYFGDNAFAPYGVKTKGDILARSTYIVDFFIQNQCKAIVIACNTATSVAAKQLRETYRLPIIGIEPALKPAHLCCQNKTIAVLATPMTLKLEKFEHLMQRYGDNALPIACPELVTYIEHGNASKADVKTYLEAKLKSIPRLGAVVLGCTHFSFIKNTLKEVLPNVPIFNGNEGTVRELKRQLAEQNLLNESENNGSVQLFSSANDDGVLKRMENLLTLAKMNQDFYI